MRMSRQWLLAVAIAGVAGTALAVAAPAAKPAVAKTPAPPVAAAPAAAAAPAPAVDDAQRLGIYREFRSAFDARQYKAALPIAQKLIALTEQQYGAEHAALVNPLANLGTVHYRLGEYDAAETQYQRAVRIIEARGNAADHQLIRPLQGLGETWFAAREYPEAILALKRAVDISRNLDGLFNIEQLPILVTLIDCYIADGRNSDAEKESQYAFRVAESNYGTRDLRLLEPLDRYARWFEYNGRYTSARALHGRALQLAEQLSGPASVQTVTPLRAIARTYSSEFLYGSEKEEAPQESDPFAANSPVANDMPRLNPDGGKALRMALDALTKHTPIDPQQRGDTLTDLGDWYMLAGDLPKAKGTYRLAWLDLAQVQGTRRLAAPRLLAYKAPISSAARARPSKPDEWDDRPVEMSFSVTRDGVVQDPKRISGDVPENMIKAIVVALRKAVYAPRVEAGVAEDTSDVRYVEHMLVRKPSAPAAAAPKK